MAKKTTKVVTATLKLFVPKGLDLEALVTSNPPTFSRYTLDKFRYIIHLIYEIPARNRTIEVVDGFVPINAKLLQWVIRDYRDYITYLETLGVIEVNNGYSPGNVSKRYRLASEYRFNELVGVAVTDVKLIRSLSNRELIIQQTSIKKYPKLYGWLEGLTINIEGAKKLALVEYELSIKEDGQEKARTRYASNMYSLSQIDAKRFWFTVDTKGKRLHTNLTNISSLLRPFVSYKGQKLVAIDVKNSQPYLSTYLIEQYYTTPDHKPCPLMLVNQVQLPADVRHYIALTVNGHLYEQLIQMYEEAFGKDFFKSCANHSEKRKLVKHTFFEIIFSKNQYRSRVKMLFRQYFPNVYDVFCAYKQVDHARLAINLQKLESDLILNKVCGRISKEKPDVPLFTIHDSVVTTENHATYVSKVIIEELTKVIGYPPTIKCEPWG